MHPSADPHPPVEDRDRVLPLVVALVVIGPFVLAAGLALLAALAG
jgi:hypothetical protein